MSIIAFIPARAGSKSIPNKNIKELGGKPLIVYSIEIAQKLGLRTIVSTDGDDIAQVAKDWGVEVIMRPVELARDQTSMFDVLKYEIGKVDPVPEVVVLLQPTSPFRTKTQLQIAIDYFVTNLDQFDSLIAVEQVPEKYNPAQVVIMTPMGVRMANGTPVSQRITRRQDFPEARVPTGSFYILKTANLSKGNIYGERVMLFETEPTLNINTVADWETAEKVCQNV